RVDDVGADARLGHELARSLGFVDASLGQIRVDPAGKEVAIVPLAATVPEQNQR
ncbi:MAG: hypothetical protein QOG30_1303, partial [Acidimicrobiaceae bacterium]